jgi:asparagine synthase (glutamine-hydrolysing)
LDIKLTNNNGYAWSKKGDIYIKGIFWNTLLNQKLTNKDVFDCLQLIENITQLSDWLKTIDGHFAICLALDKKAIIAVDRLRTMPLFYSFKHNAVFDQFISLDIVNDDFDEIAEAQFISTGYVIGNQTMLKDVFQLQAGEAVELLLDSKEIKKSDYFLYRYQQESFMSEDVLINKMDDIYTKVFERLVGGLNGKTAVIPLSGGYDSRLIVHMFNKLNYKNVICFTYGEASNWEAQISEKVAKFYGYNWIFVEYTKEELFQLYSNIDEYFDFSVKHSSFGHTQDLLAVKKLFENKLIPEDGVFIPGHSGDFVAGTHIPLGWESINIVNHLYNKHCNLWQNPYEKQVKNLISNQLGFIGNKAEKIEFWDWRERQAKYICNSVKVYEYFGYSWLLPLWSKEIMDFWTKVPISKKEGRSLYLKYALSLHGDILANPKRNKITVFYEKVSDIWFSRFFGNKHFLLYLSASIDKIFNDTSVPKFIDMKRKIFKCRRVGLNTLKMYCSAKRSK